MLLLAISLVLTLIFEINGQYGEPFIGAVGQFSYECRQSDIDVMSSPNSKEFEILSGKSFAYICDFFVDTRQCAHNPQSSGCDGIEIVWILPEGLTQIEKDKGIASTRMGQNTSMTVHDGYNIYKNEFDITNAGLIHNGQYSWKFNLKFEMKNVFQGSFHIAVIDLLQLNEPCTYDDSCKSNKCRNNKCVDKDPEPFPWLIVGICIAVAVVVIAIIVVWIVICMKRKQTLKLNDRPDDPDDITE